MFLQESLFQRGGLSAPSIEPEDRAPAKTAYQAELLENRLRKRSRHLGKWARRTGVDVYRLYDRDIPEIPLVLDRYGDAVAGALYERPYEKDEVEEDRWLTAMAGAVSQALTIPVGHIFLKQRKRQRQGAQYEKLEGRAFSRDVREGGLTFRVNLSEYLDTGFFPDRRIQRGLIRSEAAGKRILNLFCYTAAFSVYAASGGAVQVDSVDMSQVYLNWAAANLRLNGFQVETLPLEAALQDNGPSPSCRLIRADVLAFLDAASRQGRRWDIIILDPPTFSNSKKMKTTLDIRRDYRSLIARCLGLLKQGGALWFSTNARHFHLDPGETWQEFPGLRFTDMSAGTAAPDFRKTSNPRCYVFRLP